MDLNVFFIPTVFSKINMDQPLKLGRTNIRMGCITFPDILEILTRDIFS